MVNENGTNDLEKKIGVVETLEDFIISEIAPYVPFSLASKTIVRDWAGEGKGLKKGFMRKIIPNCLISSLAAAAILLYVGNSFSAGTVDYTKWSEIQKQKVVQKEQEARVYSDGRFYEADKNGDSVLDVNEFYDCVYGGRE